MKICYLATNGVYSHKIVYDGISEALAQIKIEDKDFDYIVHNISKQDDKTIENYNPDFIFLATPLASGFRVWKKYRNRKVICYDTEGLYEPGNVRDCMNYCEYMATVDKRGAEYFSQYAKDKNIACKVIHMPLGFSPNAYKSQIVSDEYKSDITIAGAIFDRRRKVIDDLFPLKDNVSLRVISPSDWINRILRPAGVKFLHKTHVSVEELGKYYSGSKIIICVNRDYEPSNDTKIPSTTPGRVFQETACKRLVMIDNSRPEIFNYFEDGKEIITFDSNNPEDLRQKVLYYLNHEQERETIAYNGYIRTMKENTWKHRMIGLFNFVKQSETQTNFI